MSVQCAVIRSAVLFDEATLSAFARSLSGFGAAIQKFQLFYQQGSKRYLCQLKFDDERLALGLPRLEGELKRLSEALDLEMVSNDAIDWGCVLLSRLRWHPQGRHLEYLWSSALLEMVREQASLKQTRSTVSVPLH